MFIIATKKPWHKSSFLKIKNKKFKLINNYKDLNMKQLKMMRPKIIFFPHWSKKVPDKIINNYTCICFHETDLPYGRGGSPIQNLIIRNKKKTMISALIMNNKIDAGNIICKKLLNLNGSAKSIFENSSKIIFQMIKDISKIKKIKSVKQKGKVTNFKRLENNSKIISDCKNLNSLYNHIRMLDAPTYKKAYVQFKNIKITLSNAIKTNKNIKAQALIELK